MDARRGLFAAVSAFLLLSSPSSFADDAAVEARQQAQIQHAFMTDAPAPSVHGERLNTLARRLNLIRGGTDGSAAARRRLSQDIERFAADVAGPGEPPRLPGPYVIRAYLFRVAPHPSDRVQRTADGSKAAAKRARARLEDARLLTGVPAAGEAPSDFLLRSLPPEWRTAQTRAVAEEILAQSKGQNIGMARAYELRGRIYSAVAHDVPYTREFPDRPGTIQAQAIASVDALGQAIFDFRPARILASLSFPGLIGMTAIEIGGSNHFSGDLTLIKTAKIMASNSLTCNIPGIKQACDASLQLAEDMLEDPPKTSPITRAKWAPRPSIGKPH